LSPSIARLAAFRPNVGDAPRIFALSLESS
jgi:hypothetical protein